MENDDRFKKYVTVILKQDIDGMTRCDNEVLRNGGTV